MKNRSEYPGDIKKTAGEDNTFYTLRLFVIGASPNSVRAIGNIKQICDRYIRNKYSLEVIDVYQNPAVTEREQIAALPLLIKKTPSPERKLIGDMSDKAKVLRGLGII